MKLYTRKGCPQCSMIHSMMDKKKIIYEECQDEEEMKSKGISHTPTLVVEDKKLVAKELFDFIKNYQE